VNAATGSTTTVNGAISAEVFSCNGGTVVGTGTINGSSAAGRCQ